MAWRLVGKRRDAGSGGGHSGVDADTGDGDAGTSGSGRRRFLGIVRDLGCRDRHVARLAEPFWENRAAFSGKNGCL